MGMPVPEVIPSFELMPGSYPLLESLPDPKSGPASQSEFGLLPALAPRIRHVLTEFIYQVESVSRQLLVPAQCTWPILSVLVPKPVLSELLPEPLPEPIRCAVH